MDTRVHLRAVGSPTGDTRLVRAHADGALAVRTTGRGRTVTVHLVGTAAGPLGGDTVTIDVRVCAGASLRLRSTAAAVALPSRHPGPGAHEAVVTCIARVEPGATLDIDLEPTIVTAAAHVRLITRIEADDESTVHVRERIVGGRHNEAAGVWSSALHLVTGAAPVLRQVIDSAVAPSRVLASEVAWGPGHLSSADAGAAGDVSCGAVLCRPALGGWSATAWGPTLDAAQSMMSPLVAAHAPMAETDANLLVVAGDG